MAHCINDSVRKPVRLFRGEKGRSGVPSSQEEFVDLAAGTVVVAAVGYAAAVVAAAVTAGIAAAAEEDQNDDQNDPGVGAVVVAHMLFTSLLMLYNILCGRIKIET